MTKASLSHHKVQDVPALSRLLEGDNQQDNCQGNLELEFLRHPSLGVPDAAWPYHDAENRLLGYAVRWNGSSRGASNNKEIRFASVFANDVLEWAHLPAPRPLYRLADLTLDVEASVLVVEGEKAAEGARKRFQSHAIVTSAGGANAASKTDWSALAGRSVTIWPDHDNPGHRYAAEVAQLCKAAGAREVKVVNLPDNFPSGWDLADTVPDGYTDSDLQQLQHAAATFVPVAVEAMPLRRPVGKPAPYPIHALGPILGPAAACIQAKTQAPIELCAQSVLGASALVVQALYDVQPSPHGDPVPTSLYLLSVAGSGLRKSSCDRLAMLPFYDLQNEKALQFEKDKHIYQQLADIWEGDYKGSLKKLSSGGPEAEADFLAVPPRPFPPVRPIVLTKDPTIEGAIKLLAENPGFIGLFSSEAGSFFGGHGMSDDQRLKTGAHLSAMWDGQTIDRVRAGEESSMLGNRRISMHLMAQPGVTSKFLGDPTLRDQGLHSRMLMTEPTSTAGTRMYRDTSDLDDGPLLRFYDRIKELLARVPWPPVGERPGLEPKTLSLSASAKVTWVQFHDANEVELGPDGEFASIQGFANRAPEHAARLAAVLECMSGSGAEVISHESMLNGIELASYYRSEALRCFDNQTTNPDLVLAEKVSSFIRSKDRVVELREIYTYGPSGVREAAVASRIVKILEAHGLIKRVPLGSRAGKPVFGWLPADAT